MNGTVPPAIHAPTTMPMDIMIIMASMHSEMDFTALLIMSLQEMPRYRP